ncbi:MAG: membrane integrity-associated transporter subunit PqiC [Gammaproteobacteria bacterium]|nr:membrane integrity-associated transporter subunit PqiC [Gammaproteobacteria bacterium]
MTLTRMSVLVLIAGGLVACGSQPVKDHYYSLVLAAEQPMSQVSAAKSGKRIIVGPVRLARYLDQPGLAMQISSSEIQSANHHFWAEPLSEAISKVLVRDITQRMQGADIERSSVSTHASPDCRVEIEFEKFHSTSDSRVVSAGRFWLHSANSRGAAQEFSISETLMLDGYANAVLKLRSTLDKLAATIAETLPDCTANNGA